MLDIHLIRTDALKVKEKLHSKGMTDQLIDEVLILDGRRREYQASSDELKQERNERSKKIGGLIKEGRDVTELKESVRILSDKIRKMDQDLKELEEKQHGILLSIPNLPHDTTPIGKTGEDNKFVGEWGEKPHFDFKPRCHWEIGESLDILDFPRATKITSANFPLLKGGLAKLERCLISWMIDLHVREHGFREIAPPYLVNRNAMKGTGQLPKMEEDMYHCEVDDLFCIPTAEVPVTNIHSNEILSGSDLPIYYAAYTPCFRREAGSYGKDTRGLTRVHQFSKVELVKLTLPETSYEELESLRKNAEEALRRLGLHYRIVELCAGDLSFSAAKCYDLEVWAPGMERYLEVSSCSNFEDFQARRMQIRFRREPGAKAELAHTLNGSGLALPRTLIALLETCQRADGTVTIPEVLRPYYGSDVLGKD
ncbi:serine--tRNA ligase [Candidatus Sumerlaeota bacterium]|nr:serine--tRNA ligase [Candidatus Sumerlaeota bacterium]